MENKYFTPDIEDICIGYELEMNWNRAYEEKWVPIKISVQDEEFAYTSELSEIVDALHDGMSEARVPYLTKEQIEAEGWKPEKSYFRKNNLYLFFENNELEIEFGEPFTWDASDSDVRYKGECKDINTFRKLIKLLGI
jgi:hypothetical protein